MTNFYVRPITEADIRSIVEQAGGRLAHADANLLKDGQKNADFILSEAIIELKLLDDDGLEKLDRQAKLANLFRSEGFGAPVVVLDRNNLSAEGQRKYDRAIEGPIRKAVGKARKQLKQTRDEYPETTLSILWIINNGYTAINHDDLINLVAHRARNDTSNIDGVIVGGCYFHSDDFDSFFLWPFDYVSIGITNFDSFKALENAWHGFAENFMTQVMRGEFDAAVSKGAVIDSQFEHGGVTFVKPAPPIGGQSEFYVHGRQRKDSSGLKKCPPIALTFPGLTRAEWRRFRTALPDEPKLQNDFGGWLRIEQRARDDGTALRPFIAVPISFEGWRTWCVKARRTLSFDAMFEYANDIFQMRIQATILNAREAKDASVRPVRYILLVTDEIGQDKANDLSHIAEVNSQINGEDDIRPIVQDIRAFHEHALALASAYALDQGIDHVIWIRDQRYAWT